MNFKYKQILDGWKNYISGHGEIKPIFKKRARICGSCKYAVKGTYEKLMPDFTLKNIQGMKCDFCKCPLSTKIRAKDSKCPLFKWL